MKRSVSGAFFPPVEQRKSNEGRSMREALPAAGTGSLTLAAEGLVRRRAHARQSERKTLGGKARARTQAARAAVASAVALLRASGVRPSSELARTPREERDEPGPLCNPRAEMHARTETREKASEGMRPSSEVTPESQQGRGRVGVPKRLRLCDNTPRRGPQFFL